MLARRDAQNRIRNWEREERAHLLPIAKGEVPEPVVLDEDGDNSRTRTTPDEDGWEEKERVDEALERGAKMLAGLQEAQWESLKAKRGVSSQITKADDVDAEPSTSERAIGLCTFSSLQCLFP
jgi:hypothetical protein